MTKEQKLFKSLILADLRVASHFNDSDNKHDRQIFAYHIQQAIEKTIKLKASIEGLNLWGHDIRYLINRCDIASIDIGVPVLIRRNAEVYTRWKSTCRYNPTTRVNKKSLGAAYYATLKWLNSDKTRG